MARTTNEQLKQKIEELYKKLPNGEFKLIKVQLLEMQDEIKALSESQEKLTKKLYNPDDGIVVTMKENHRISKELHDKMDRYLPMIDKVVLNISFLEKFRTNVVKGMWVAYSAIIALAAKAIFWEQ
tara:strand:+ start:171 stop:548 length:378 start_codon:yes stop_codon:yes gene_type:complete